MVVVHLAYRDASDFGTEAVRSVREGGATVATRRAASAKATPTARAPALAH